MKSALTTQITEETDISEVIETIKQQVKDAKLPDIDVVRILWDVLMDAIQWSGKNQQQNANAALGQVNTWAKLLNAFCTNGKLEFELMYKVQIQCYEDAKLLKLFPEFIRSLYDLDMFAEDTIFTLFVKVLTQRADPCPQIRSSSWLAFSGLSLAWEVLEKKSFRYGCWSLAS